MIGWNRIPSPLGRLGPFALLLGAVPSSAQDIHTWVEPAVPPPPVMLNEVVFDSAGIDGSMGNGEWIELYTPDAVNLLGYSVRTDQGQVLYTFGDLDVPAYSVVLVLLSDMVTSPYDADPSDRTMAVAANLPHGDYLGNHEGGVRVVRPNGRNSDALFWGTGSPPATAQNAEWFDLSFSQGVPLAEGESLGRPADPRSTYTGTLADWSGHGGRNALMPTPGGRNGVDVFNYSGMLSSTQKGIVDILIGFSDQADRGRITLTDAGVGDVDYNYANQTFTVEATHVFNIEDFGQAGLLSGTVVSTYSFDETPGAVSYTFEAEGELTSTTGFSLEIDYSMDVAGFHGTSPTRTSATAATWTEGQGVYGYTIDSVTTGTRTGQNTWVMDHSRDVTDYGGAGVKHSQTSTVFTQVAEGVYDVDFDMTRDAPANMPAFWNAGTQVLEGIETAAIDHYQTTLSNGDMAGSFTRFDRAVDGVLHRTLDPAQVAIYTATADLANSNSAQVARSFQLDLPVLEWGQPQTISLAVNSVDAVVGSKSVSSASREVSHGGYDVVDDEFWIDPPLEAARPGGMLGVLLSILQGCPHCKWGNTIHIHACDICDPNLPPHPVPLPPEPPPTPDPEPKGEESAWDAVTTCAARGAAVGSSGGFLVGSWMGWGAGNVMVPGLGSVPGWAAGGTAGSGIGGAGGSAVGAGICLIAWLLD